MNSVGNDDDMMSTLSWLAGKPSWVALRKELYVGASKDLLGRKSAANQLRNLLRATTVIGTFAGIPLTRQSWVVVRLLRDVQVLTAALEEPLAGELGSPDPDEYFAAIEAAWNDMATAPAILEGGVDGDIAIVANTAVQAALVRKKSLTIEHRRLLLQAIARGLLTSARGVTFQLDVELGAGVPDAFVWSPAQRLEQQARIAAREAAMKAVPLLSTHPLSPE